MNEMNKFFHLLGYNIAKGGRLNEADEQDVPDIEEKPLGYEKKSGLGVAPKPGVPATGTAPEETAPNDDTPMPTPDAAAPNPATAEDEVAPGGKPAVDGEAANDVESEDKKNEDMEDVLAKLVRVQSEKLNAIEAYMAQNDINLQQVQAKTTQIDAVQGEILHMKDQIKILTPPTPLESGNAMIAAAGGTRVEDYWNNWLAKNKRDGHMDSNPYYPKEDGGDYYLDSKDVPDLSKEDAKRSFMGEY